MTHGSIVARIYDIHRRLPAREAVIANRLDEITRDLHRIAEDMRVIAEVDTQLDSYNQLHSLADKLAKVTDP